MVNKLIIMDDIVNRIKNDIYEQQMNLNHYIDNDDILYSDRVDSIIHLIKEITLSQATLQTAIDVRDSYNNNNEIKKEKK